MNNNQPELHLINKFKEILVRNRYVDDSKLQNFGRNTKKYADIEFVSVDGDYFVIEAKSHHSRDAHNSYHKLFGELLKETGKNESTRNSYGEKLSFGILIPADPCTILTNTEGATFYRNHFKNIPLEIYVGFGKLVRLKYVFVCSEIDNYVKQYTWEGFYKSETHIDDWS